MENRNSPKTRQAPTDSPAVGKVQWGDFRRLQPLSSYWGVERGRPIDRFYIERFLAEHSHELRGKCLEVENPNYSKKFGGNRLEQVDVLDVNKKNLRATLIGDLSTGEGIPHNSYDCFILTQTLQFIYDVVVAVQSSFNLLKPGGIMLVTVPGITPIPVRDKYSKFCCWSFTTTSIRKIFAAPFGNANIEVNSHGNVLSATAFLWGLAMHELTVEELEHHDPDYPVTITVRAQKL